MAAQSRRSRVIQAMMVTVAIVAVYECAVRSKLMKDAVQPKESVTAQQIAERSAPICRLLAENEGSIRQTTEPLSRMYRDGSRHKLWSVDCVDGKGEHVAHTLWDAETGRLVLATHYVHRNVTGKSAPLAVDTVPKIAWRWMETLGGSTEAQRWSVPQTPVLIGDSWRVVLQSEHYSATVILDYKTGDLVYLTIRSLDQAIRAS